MSSARVFVVQSPQYRDRTTQEIVTKYDLTPAKVHGTLVTILGPGKIRIDRVPQALQQIAAVLNDYKPADFILAIGDPAAICAACAVASRRSPVIQLLRWDRATSAYEIVKLEMGELNAEAHA